MRRFILDNTSRMAPPHICEIQLYLADEAHELWHRTEAELDQLGLEPPYWAFAWAGGQGLARYVLDQPQLVRGKRVLDLGSGSGLVAIAAALAGAHDVLANDIDPFCGVALDLNAAANGVTVAFDNSDLTKTDLRQPLQFDVVLAGDVFFDSAIAQRILEYLQHHANRGCEVIVGDPGRAYLPKERLTKLAQYAVPVTRALEDHDIKKTAVYQLNVSN